MQLRNTSELKTNGEKHKFFRILYFKVCACVSYFFSCLDAIPTWKLQSKRGYYEFKKNKKKINNGNKNPGDNFFFILLPAWSDSPTALM